MSYKIVVAKFHELFEWIHYLNKDNVVIYNKADNRLTHPIENAIPRENKGREADTFLHHIVENYNDLPDYLILIQGNPFDHTKGLTTENLQEKIDEIIPTVTDIQPFFTDWYYEQQNYEPAIRGMKYYSLFFEGEVPRPFVFAPGNQYIIPRENILSRPLEFYRKINEMVLKSHIICSRIAHNPGHPLITDEVDGWVLERIFMYLFKKDLPIHPDFL